MPVLPLLIMAILVTSMSCAANPLNGWRNVNGSAPVIGDSSQGTSPAAGMAPVLFTNAVTNASTNGITNRMVIVGTNPIGFTLLNGGGFSIANGAITSNFIWSNFSVSNQRFLISNFFTNSVLIWTTNLIKSTFTNVVRLTNLLSVTSGVSGSPTVAIYLNLPFASQGVSTAVYAWVTTAAGTYIDTIQRYSGGGNGLADNNPTHWKATSGMLTTDGITSATIRGASATNYRVTNWYCKNKSGSVVTNQNVIIHVEICAEGMSPPSYYYSNTVSLSTNGTNIGLVVPDAIMSGAHVHYSAWGF